ncbi:MAG: polynucleotide kinase-phosphatase [Armatimonadetes bacterium]|nr:polynucleotide kinase-phosphatase [Armatimonadota bacterium]
MRIPIPEFATVVLIGTSGSGKSTFCRKHFLPTEVLSSDTFRGLVCDDEDSLSVSTHAFQALHFMLAKRLELGRTCVIDATNVQKESRAPLLEIATRYHSLKVAIVLNVTQETCRERNAQRANRQFGSHVIRNQHSDLRRTLGQLKYEGFHKIFILKPEEIDNVEIVRERIWSRRPEETGPFDIIGDIHGCMAELSELLTQLGWSTEPSLSHPEGRKMVFLGDLVDRGPDPIGVLKFVMSAVAEEKAICVPGNHDIRLAKALMGRKVGMGHGLAETLVELEKETPEFRQEVAKFLDGLVSHAVMDEGKLCVAHAGLLEEMQGRGSRAVRDFALYGETTGEIDEFGLPVRYQWARDYRGKAMVVYGHTPVPVAEWLNNTIDIDTGCCFGGSLTALRYPERELVSVRAHATYTEPAKPLGFESSGLSSQQIADDVLDLADVIGRMSIETRTAGRITIREENAIAALEVMSRFAADPRWLVYLPPTMSPCQTSNRDGFLEYPTEALSYYKEAGVKQAVCEEKHMGSRAVAVVCKSPEAARKRFGVETGESGIITSRTGRRFFDTLETEQTLVKRISDAAERAGVYEELGSDWLLIDLELMPWSAKAVGLLRDQYAPVGASAVASAEVWQSVAEGLAKRGMEDADTYLDMARRRSDSATRFRDAYRRYCWNVDSIEDYKLAPFHLLASEGRLHVDKNHEWHMSTLGRICDQDPKILRRTPHRIVNLESEEEIQEACAWWEQLVSAGGEGMVVKPYDFLHSENGRLLQPAVKCRGPEYLRIIYGPEYLEPEYLSRLRSRGLNRKRSLASREFALGLEAMERFIQGESLRRVHECVFGVLALESEPVDPRL